jgi:endonuclease I
MELDEAESSRNTVHLIYLDADIPKYPLSSNHWVPGHVWPMNSTNDSTTTGAFLDYAFTDLHNLRPSHPSSLHAESSTSRRETLSFGNCDNNTSDGVCEVVVPDTIMGNNASSSMDGDTCICGSTLQPPLNARGIVARALLYMQLRYGTFLRLTDCPSGSNTDMGYLTQVLEWHQKHPPTEREILRNQWVCAHWQGKTVIHLWIIPNWRGRLQ